MSKAGVNFVFAIAVCFVVGGVTFFALQNGGEDKKRPAPPLQPPRTESPMGDYTRFYERQELDLPQADGSQRKMTFFIYRPEPPYPEGLKFPLVFLLHGTPGNAYAGSFLIQKDMRVEFPAFIAVPVLPYGDTWSYPRPFPELAPDVEAQVSQMRDRLPDVAQAAHIFANSLPIDADRIYVLGCSEGGFGVFGAARDYADTFAAGVAISGGWTVGDAAAMTRMPVLAIHGAQDPVVQAFLSRDIVAAVQAQGGAMTYLERPNMGHACPLPELYGRTVWEWLFSHHRQ